MTRRIALALSGGIGLGAFQLGTWTAMEAAGMRPDWILGTSIGAVNAVLIAGGPAEGARARLERFWEAIAFEPLPAANFWIGGMPMAGPLRRAAGDAAISQTLLLGRSGLFRPNPKSSKEAPALYDLDPLRRHLLELVDFRALHVPGAPRLTLTASDLLAGDRVTFDTGTGDRIGVEEVVACCSLPPLYPAVEIGGRLLADGGLTGNLPLEAALSTPGAEEVLCIAVELFARQGARPTSISTAAARAADIAFGSRTRQAVEAEARAHLMRGALREAAGPDAALAQGPRTVTVLLLGERAEPDGAGVLKPFDFSRVAIAARVAAGADAARTALALPPAVEGGFMVREATRPVRG